MGGSSISLTEEEAIIRKRFLTQTVATSAAVVPPFKKLVKRYTEFSEAVREGRGEDAARFHDELLADVYAIQTHMRRLEAAASAFQREQHLYQQKQKQLHAAIDQTEQDISNRKLQLEEAREELGRQQQYEAVKERVVKVPARSATRAEMAAVEKEIADLDQQGAALEVSMGRRKSQFASILHLIEQVHQGLEQEGTEEGSFVEEGAPQPMNVE
ncbi:hypothetical protein Ndes2526B_g09194 [Nannochloris sp. 'desiccata']|nr:hypothetical protein KSW81_003767 [Chlorella desiccata (nom. nud.)]KAH7615882.1 putative THO complex subunit 7A [Chlorella desiccata (nom. nud.)]